VQVHSSPDERGREPAGRFVQANGLAIYYEEDGVGEPLILVHGGMETGRSWDAVMPLLASHYRVIRPDSRGHGRTDNPAGRLSYALMADDVLAFMRALELDRPFVCGWSDGGQVALELAIRDRDAARAVIANGVLANFSEQYLRVVRGYLFVDEDLQVDVARFAAEHPRAVERLREKHSHVYGDDYWRAYLQQIAALWLTPTGLTAERLQQITTPMLISIGDRDEFVLLDEALVMYRQIPHGELAVAPGATHSFPETKPELFAATILEFLGRHSGGA